jgi:hypothetical protein
MNRRRASASRHPSSDHVGMESTPSRVHRASCSQKPAPTALDSNASDFTASATRPACTTVTPNEPATQMAPDHLHPDAAMAI